MTEDTLVYTDSPPNPASAKDTGGGYDDIKEFEGRKYTGMRVGASHCWYYRQGEWRETKVAPDKWQFAYAVNKRRKWDAPECSGAPVGTEYHWYILAHQSVRKINANEYTTSMTGTKYKLAHRRPTNEAWSAGERAQLRRLIAILEENIIQLQRELGEPGKALRAMPREGEPVLVTMDRGRREMTAGRQVPPEHLPHGFTVGQEPLETYSAP